MNLQLAGKIALVTGSTQGIGLAIARTLITEGATVIVSGRREALVQQTVRSLSAHGVAHGVAADLFTPEGARTVAQAAEALGPVDILVNNAGRFEVRPFGDISDDEWQAMLELNLMSGIRLSRALLPGMLQRNRGRIVFIASEQSAKPNADMLHYAVSKAAQVSLARGLAELTRGTQVTVNSVLAAPTWSEGVETFLTAMAKREGKSVEQMRTAYFEGPGRSSIIQRWASADEIAAQVAFLCSPLSGAVNGAAQRVDGGIIRSLF
ncbi:MAG TPA: SDR family oxidoreductase [Burkholderiales bacterium]|nr:SDR family oxidoreductase [Burkholderiales bacterium]